MNFVAQHKLDTIVVIVKYPLIRWIIVLRHHVYDYIFKPYVFIDLLNTFQVVLNAIRKVHRYLVDNSPDIVAMLD